ncbi:hypothetical protein O0L34_g5563 [Tuta absoluta]|nr:hypothetical protein O0L34_g5563 [Tuta absoluta]
MFQLLTLLLVTLGVNAAYAPRGVDNCSRLPSVDEVSTLCRVRTLEADGSSFATATPEGARRLTVECNQLLLFESTIEANYFQRFSALTELTLHNCKLLRIPGNAFEGLRELKKLSIRSKNYDWSPNKNLELSLGTFNGLRELQTLDLGENNLKLIPSDVFCPLDNLQVLNVTSNKIKSVDRLGFGKSCGSGLRSLDLSHNEIKLLTEDSEITGLRRLQELKLQHNNISDVSGETFNELIALRILNISYNFLQSIPEGTFANTKELREIYLNNNLLFELARGVFHRLDQLLVLDLSYNLLSSAHIDGGTFVGLIRLVILNLSNNALTRIDDINSLRLSPVPSNKSLPEFYIGGNPFDCDCSMEWLPLINNMTAMRQHPRIMDLENVLCKMTHNRSVTHIPLSNLKSTDFLSYISDNVPKIVDIADVFCWSNALPSSPQKKELNLNGTICSDYYAGDSVIDNMLVSNYMPMMVTTLTGFMLIMLVILVIFLFRDTIRIWLYTSCGIRLFPFTGVYDDTDKLYDAYVCYSPKDDDFVIQTLAAELENGNPSYHLCLHYRDIPQHNVAYMQCNLPLPEAAEASRRIILILTRNFIETEWSRFECRQALHEILKTRIYSLLIIEDSSVLPEAECDPDLRPYLKTSSRIRWGQNKFWEKLRYVMPDRKSRKKSSSYRNNINSYSMRSGMQNGTMRSFSFTEKMRGSAEGVSSTPQFVEDRSQQMQTGAYGPDGRPPSDHIYSSIDSDYSSLELAGSNPNRRREFRQWPPPPPLIDTQHSGHTGQAYLV